MTDNRGIRDYPGYVRVETAVGVLMELGCWDAPGARHRLHAAARDVNAPVETVADALVRLVDRMHAKA